MNFDNTMNFDKEAFANVFGYAPTPEQEEWLKDLLESAYADGYSEGENDASCHHSYYG